MAEVCVCVSSPGPVVYCSLKPTSNVQATILSYVLVFKLNANSRFNACYAHEPHLLGSHFYSYIIYKYKQNKKYDC